LLVEEALVFIERADVIAVLLESTIVGGSARLFGSGTSFEDAFESLVGRL
jgi:hypothetical protein